MNLCKVRTKAQNLPFLADKTLKNLKALLIKVQAEKEAKEAKEAADAERKAKEAEAKAEILSGEWYRSKVQKVKKNAKQKLKLENCKCPLISGKERHDLRSIWTDFESKTVRHIINPILLFSDISLE